jgi:hypothetical protein
MCQKGRTGILVAWHRPILYQKLFQLKKKTLRKQKVVIFAITLAQKFEISNLKLSLINSLYFIQSIARSFTFILKVGVEDSIVNIPYG